MSHFIKYDRYGKVDLKQYRSSVARQKIKKMGKEDAIAFALALLDTAVISEQKLKALREAMRIGKPE